MSAVGGQPPPAAGAAGNARPASGLDQKLGYALVQLAGIPNDANFRTHPTVLALRHAGIATWQSLATLSEEDILAFSYVPPTTNDLVELPVAQRRMLCIILACWHQACRTHKREVKITRITPEMFNKYRTTFYDPREPIVPWYKNLPGEIKENEQWTKNLKVSLSDYKEFKDENMWMSYKEAFMTTIESHGLENMLDPDYEPENIDVHDRKKKFVYKIFLDKFKTPFARGVVKRYRNRKDVASMWKEIRTFYDESVSAQMKASSISTFLTSARFKNLHWRGTDTEFIHYWASQAYLHNQIVSDPDEEFSDKQFVRLLEACLVGTYLEQQRNLALMARKAAGVPVKELTLQEFVEILTEQTNIRDYGKKSFGAKTSVNAHDMTFPEDDVDDNGGFIPENSYDVDVHIMDTPVEQVMVNQTDMSRGNPRKSFLPKHIWFDLTNEEKEAWNAIDAMKQEKILQWGAQRKESKAKPGRPPSRSIGRTPTRSANQHELQAGDTEEESPGDTEGNGETPTIQISTHDFHEKIESVLATKDSESQSRPNPALPSLLDMATTKTKVTKGPPILEGDTFNINAMMSVPTKRANEDAKRGVLPRSQYTVNAHIFKGMDDMDTDSEDDDTEFVLDGTVPTPNVHNPHRNTKSSIFRTRNTPVAVDTMYSDSHPPTVANVPNPLPATRPSSATAIFRDIPDEAQDSDDEAFEFSTTLPTEATRSTLQSAASMNTNSSTIQGKLTWAVDATYHPATMTYDSDVAQPQRPAAIYTGNQAVPNDTGLSPLDLKDLNDAAAAIKEKQVPQVTQSDTNTNNLVTDQVETPGKDQDGDTPMDTTDHAKTPKQDTSSDTAEPLEQSTQEVQAKAHTSDEQTLGVDTSNEGNQTSTTQEDVTPSTPHKAKEAQPSSASQKTPATRSRVLKTGIPLLNAKGKVSPERFARGHTTEASSEQKDPVPVQVQSEKAPIASDPATITKESEATTSTKDETTVTISPKDTTTVTTPSKNPSAVPKPTYSAVAQSQPTKSESSSHEGTSLVRLTKKVATKSTTLQGGFFSFNDNVSEPRRNVRRRKSVPMDIHNPRNLPQKMPTSEFMAHPYENVRKPRPAYGDDDTTMQNLFDNLSTGDSGEEEGNGDENNQLTYVPDTNMGVEETKDDSYIEMIPTMEGQDQNEWMPVKTKKRKQSKSPTEGSRTPSHDGNVPPEGNAPPASDFRLPGSN